jgi:4-hydroxybenzoate polyprenyltransferase
MASTTNTLGNAGWELPRAGYAKRMKCYLAEMYPVPWRLALAALTYFGVMGFLARIHGVTTFPTTLDSLVGVGSLFSLMLIIRLMDEIKDKEIDRELFPHRPLPSGRIFETDINATIVVLALLYLSTNLLAGRVFWIALIVLGYACLMFKHFFIPQILQKTFCSPSQRITQWWGSCFCTSWRSF